MATAFQYLICGLCCAAIAWLLQATPGAIVGSFCLGMFLGAAVRELIARLIPPYEWKEPPQ